MTMEFTTPEGFNVSSDDTFGIREYFEGSYEIVHQIKGRIRLRLPQLAYDRDYGDRLNHGLTSVAGVTQVNVNPTAKSVTICYQNNTPAADLIRDLPVPVNAVPVTSATNPSLLPPFSEAFDHEFDRILTEFTRTTHRFNQESKPVLHQLAIMLLQAMGTISLVIGVIGFVLPLLPGTPFLILASLFFFAASELSSY